VRLGIDAGGAGVFVVFLTGGVVAMGPERVAAIDLNHRAAEGTDLVNVDSYGLEVAFVKTGTTNGIKWVVISEYGHYVSSYSIK